MKIIAGWLCGATLASLWWLAGCFPKWQSGGLFVFAGLATAATIFAFVALLANSKD